MKKLFTLIMVIFITFSVFSQSPEKMSYQCVVRNASGILMANQSVGIKISILQGNPSGTVIYSETYSPNPQTNANGLLTIEIGGGTTITGTFSAINWASGPYFLKTETDPTGGTTYTITGTSQLLSAPYALLAKTAATANYNDLSNLPALNISNWNTAFGWGNHAGLYRPVGWVPAWTDVTGKPTFATVATSGDYNDLSNQPTIVASQWTTAGSNIYYNTGNVGVGTSSPVTLIHAHGSPVTSRGQLSLSSPAGQDIFLSFYEANTFKSYLWFNVADQDLRLQNFTAGNLELNPYGGKVGVGTLNPATTLDVNGVITAIGGTFSNDLLVNGLTVGKGTASVSTNVALGTAVLSSNTTGSRNTGNGYQALYSNRSGSNNTASGDQALYHNTTGYENTSNGIEALFYNETGYKNTSIGAYALLNNTSGSSNTAIGYQADVSTGSLTNATAIGSGALVSSSNNIIFGNNQVIGWGFGVSPGTAAIRVGSSTSNGNGATLTKTGVWTNASDISKKYDIENINYGINEVMKLRPVTYKLKGLNNQDIGFIAQEVKKIVPEIVYGEDGQMTISYGQLTSVLVKAVQEQQKQIEDLKKEIALLKSK